MSDLYFPSSLPCLRLQSRRIVWSTEVQDSPSGVEHRPSYRNEPRYEYSFEFDTRDSLSERAELEGFVNAHQGRGQSFLLVDAVDGITRRVRFDEDETEAERIAGGVYGWAIDLVTVHAPADSDGVVLVDDDLAILTEEGTTLI